MLSTAKGVKNWVDEWMETCENLDPLRTLPKIVPGPGLLEDFVPCLGGKKKEVFAKQDGRSSESFEAVSVDARHRPEAILGTWFAVSVHTKAPPSPRPEAPHRRRLDVEVLCAGGWTRSGVGDVFTDEDCYALLVCDGCVARTSDAASE